MALDDDFSVNFIDLGPLLPLDSRSTFPKKLNQPAISEREIDISNLNLVSEGIIDRPFQVFFQVLHHPNFHEHQWGAPFFLFFCQRLVKVNVVLLLHLHLHCVITCSTGLKIPELRRQLDLAIDINHKMDGHQQHKNAARRCKQCCLSLFE